MATHRIRIVSAALIAATGVFFSSLSNAGLIYRIDIDSTSGNSGIATESGWTSLNAGSGGAADGNDITVGGVTFTIFSSDGSRSRSAGTSNLTRDFVFDDGPGQAVGLYVNGLGAGKWEASVYSFDTLDAGNQIIGMNGKVVGWEEIYTTSFASNESTPYTFRFDRADFNDGFGIFARENNGDNRSRFNALELRQVPVPATLALVGLGLVALGWKRRKTA